MQKAQGISHSDKSKQVTGRIVDTPGFLYGGKVCDWSSWQVAELCQPAGKN